jgi:hypothetical protein
MRCCGSTSGRAWSRGRQRLPDPHGSSRISFSTVFLVDGLGKGAATLEGARALAAAAPPRTEGETDMQSKYPNVCVALVGEDENAFAILEVQRALREAGVPVAEVKAFTLEACSGDYYHLLETVVRTVETT